ncbi:MAG: hypothetical protein GXP27_03280 [Planctomycetes bacterium]|nr:hypothetical protein [Planctomycetota bacterium]
MNDRSCLLRKRLSTVLSLVFAIAIVMGAGPGLYLVNPAPSDSAAHVTWLGLPILYAWIVFWFLVEAMVIVLAYLFLWDAAQESDVLPESQHRDGPHGNTNP